MTFRASPVGMLASSVAAVVLLLLFARFAPPTFFHKVRQTLPLRYEIVNEHGSIEGSLFSSPRNSKIPNRILAKFMQSAANPLERGSCSASSKPSLWSRIVGPNKVSAQSGCESPCSGSWNGMCKPGRPDCPNLYLCCYEDDPDLGCQGVYAPCDNGGGLCGQSTCSED
jgi:hypothetical protein